MSAVHRYRVRYLVKGTLVVDIEVDENNPREYLEKFAEKIADDIVMQLQLEYEFDVSYVGVVAVDEST